MRLPVLFTGSNSDNGDNSGKIDRLSSNSYDEAVDKLDEIIAYCDFYPNLTNDTIKAGAKQTKGNMNLMGGRSYWNSTKETWIDEINSLLEGLE
jgi:hypothetical protein